MTPRPIAGAIVLALAAAGCAPAPEAAPDAGTPDRAWKEVTIMQRATGPEGITAARLGNGLRVLVQEKHDVPVVATYLWYRVGSGHERAGATGLAHYLEHLLFKGTDRYQKGQIDALTLRNGGANNAFTWRDYTAYFFNFAADRWDVALQIEANRMRKTAFDAKEFAAEKQVVIEELYRALDRPTGRLEIAMHERLWGAGHPYGHHTLGTETDLNERVGVEQVKAFYDRHYWPSNATLVVVGAVQTDAVLARVGELFGAIPRGEPNAVPSAPRPAPPGDARIELADDVAIARAVIEYLGVTVGEPDDFVLDVVARLLGGGVASRLHQRLVEREQRAVEVSCGNASGNLPGSFNVEIEARAGADRAAIERAVAEEMARLAAEDVPAPELERARNQILAEFTFAMETADRRAEYLGLYDTHGDYTLMTRYPDAIAAVTPARIRAAAAKYLVPANRLTGWVVPAGKATGGGGGAGAGGDDRRDRRCWRRRQEAPGGGVRPPVLDVERLTLDNGLRVRLLRRPGAPIVAIQAHVDADRRFEPAAKAGLAALHGECLRSGTPTRDALAIAETIEGVGGQLATSATGLTCKVRAGDVGLALELVADLLQRSTFPEAEVGKKRDEQQSRIRAQEDEPTVLAALAARAMVYGSHPYGRPALGTFDTCGALTRDDLVAWNRVRVVPASTLLAVVGDFDPVRLRAAIAERFARWTGAPPAPVALPALTPQQAPAAVYISRPDDAQLNISLMRLGVRRDDPDWYRLLVMDYILGRGPGFTDRLSKTLRDELGLCYTVYAFVAETADVEPGVFQAYMGTAPRNKLQALYGIRMQIARMRDELVADAELADAKAYLTGRFVFQFETREQLAAYLVNAERWRLPDDWLPRYADRVNAVSAAEVRDAARRHLHPEHLSLAIAGRVDAEGFTLDAPK